MSTLTRPAPQEGDASARAAAFRLPSLGAVPLWGRVALAGYGLLALIGLAYVVVAALWAHGSDRQRILVAVVLAAPLVLGLLWPRLTGFKAFGVEITLAQATAPVDARIAAAIASPDIGSAAPQLVLQVQALAEKKLEVAKVDLRDESYWWSTRLFLFAALADDFSDVDTFVFVSSADERFVGMAPPPAVRHALAVLQPPLEPQYQALLAQTAGRAPPERIAQIVFSWTAISFGATREADFAVRVSQTTLLDAGLELETDAVQWRGYSTRPLLRALIEQFDGRWVALLRGPSFNRVVDRRSLAERIAASAL